MVNRCSVIKEEMERLVGLYGADALTETMAEVMQEIACNGREKTKTTFRGQLYRAAILKAAAVEMREGYVG